MMSLLPNTPIYTVSDRYQTRNGAKKLTLQPTAPVSKVITDTGTPMHKLRDMTHPGYFIGYKRAKYKKE